MLLDMAQKEEVMVRMVSLLCGNMRIQTCMCKAIIGLLLDE